MGTQVFFQDLRRVPVGVPTLTVCDDGGDVGGSQRRQVRTVGRTPRHTLNRLVGLRKVLLASTDLGGVVGVTVPLVDVSSVFTVSVPRHVLDFIKMKKF